MSKHASGEPGKIVITQGQLESMVESFTQTWQRPPTHEEWEGLIRDRVREEVYYREAMALGLDKDDIIIRRRLRQKMEFVSDDVAAQAQPTDAELNAYLQAHPDSFRVEQRFTFRQVYLNPDKARRKPRARRRATARAVEAGTAARPISRRWAIRSCWSNHYDALPASEVGKQFGEKFATAWAGLPLGQWQGPVESGYGVHLVFVSERTEGRVPALAEVRDAVRREWDEAQRLEANEKFYQELLKRYTVTIERPGAGRRKQGRSKKVK